MNSVLYQSIRDYLENHYTLALATCEQDMPWAAALFYASDARLNLYFVSRRDTRHATLIARNARVAATINEDYRDWRLIQGLQLEGRAALLQGAERNQAREAYVAKFPFVHPPLDPGDEHADALWRNLELSDFFRITPERILMIDNRRGFGHREELILPGTR